MCAVSAPVSASAESLSWKMKPEGHKMEVTEGHIRDLQNPDSWTSGISLVLTGTSLLCRLTWDLAAMGAWQDAGLGSLDATTLNVSVGGSWVSSILHRLTEMGLLEAIKSKALSSAGQQMPKLFILEGGANDMSSKVTASQLATGIGQCMDAIHRVFPLAHVSVFGSFAKGWFSN